MLVLSILATEVVTSLEKIGGGTSSNHAAIVGVPWLMGSFADDLVAWVDFLDLAEGAPYSCQNVA